MSSVHSPRISSWQQSIVVTSRAQKAGPLGFFLVTLLPNHMAFCFNHADSFEIDHLNQNFHLIFWLKVNNDTDFEACILEYDRYEPRLGARSCHRYLEFWQDLKISIYYINHVLLVILRLMGTFKNVFKILIVRIPCWGRTLNFTKDMNNHMVDSHFQVKGNFDILPKNETHPDMFFKGVALPQNSHLLISLP